MTQLKLTYFDVHGGRGEPARLAMHIGGIAFETRPCCATKCWTCWKTQT